MAARSTKTNTRRIAKDRGIRDTRTGYALNLSPHGEDEEHEEVHDKDRPVHGDVEGLRECAEERDQRRASY